MDMQALLALQEEDGHIRDLQRELRVLLPARKSEAQARLKTAREDVEKALQANLAAQREYERFHRDYTRQRDIMSRAERNAAISGDARVASVAMSQHAAASEAAARAEAAAAEASAHLTPEERRLDQARAFEAEEERAVQDLLDTIRERKGQVEEELVRVQARREELAKAVPPVQLKYYERLRLTRWPCAVEYHRAEGVCSGCNLVQPHSVTQAVLHADKTPNNPTMVTCPACGRILL